MAQSIAILSKELDIPIASGFIMTHSEIATVDDYGPFSGDPETRWDLYLLEDYDGIWKSGGDILRGKAIWYQNLLYKP